jgi:hypothetical protein
MTTLTQLANQHLTDKGTSQPPYHGYSEVYDAVLDQIRFDVSKILEIGIDKGGSLRMWKDYFPNAIVHGADVKAYQFFQEDRIYTHFANQSSADDLNNLIKKIGTDIDVVIDDGGHDVIHQQITLGLLFKHVRSGGVYIVEDLHTSFLHEWLKNHDLKSDYEYTAYNVLKRLEDTKKLETPYITAEDSAYIQNNVSDIRIYDMKDDREHITCILIKK